MHIAIRGRAARRDKVQIQRTLSSRWQQRVRTMCADAPRPRPIAIPLSPPGLRLYVTLSASRSHDDRAHLRLRANTLCCMGQGRTRGRATRAQTDPV